jgi:hypothetical protein
VSLNGILPKGIDLEDEITGWYVDVNSVVHSFLRYADDAQALAQPPPKPLGSIQKRLLSDFRNL